MPASHAVGCGIHFDESGKQIEHIGVPEPWIANIALGGKDRDLLFITASKNACVLV